MKNDERKNDLLRKYDRAIELGRGKEAARIMEKIKEIENVNRIQIGN